jgi:hypothetical protein
MSITTNQRAANLAARLHNAADPADGLTIQYAATDPITGELLDANFHVVSTSLANEAIAAGTAVSAE